MEQFELMMNEFNILCYELEGPYFTYNTWYKIHYFLTLCNNINNPQLNYLAYILFNKSAYKYINLMKNVKYNMCYCLSVKIFLQWLGTPLFFNNQFLDHFVYILMQTNGITCSIYSCKTGYVYQSVENLPVYTF